MAAPVVDPVSNASIPVLKTLIVPLTGSDADGDPLTYSVASDNAAVTGRIITNTVDVKLTVANFGEMTIKLIPEFAPNTVSTISSYVQAGKYDGLTFHRIISGFMNQGGDPNGNGSGSLGPQINDEFNLQAIFSGVGQMAMANAGPDTSGSQFFITVSPQRSLDFTYTLFGQVVHGFDVLNAINQTPTGSNDRPITPVVITSATIVQDTSDAVLLLQSTVAGSAQITVTAQDPGGLMDAKVFTASSISDTQNDPPFLTTVAGPTITAVEQPVELILSASDLENSTLVYEAFIAGSTQNAIIQLSGNKVTVTPKPGFTGNVPVTVGVKQSTGNTRFDTQVVNITVKAQMITPQGFNPIVQVGTQSSVRIATFTPEVPNPPASFSALVTWSDTSTSPATVAAGANGAYDVFLDVNKSAAGVFPFSVEITDQGANIKGSTTGTLRSTIDILTAQLAQISPTPGTRDVSGIIATLLDVSANRPITDLTAQIEWGDSTSSAGTLVATGQGQYNITGSHTYPSLGDFTIKVTVTAVNNDTAATQGTVTILNVAPVLDAIGNKSVTEGSTLSFTATAADPDAGQTLTYSLGAGAPAGATIDPTTGVFSWTPTVGPASADVTIIVTDNGSPTASDSETFTISVTDVIPVVTAGPEGAIDEGGTYTGSGSFTDPGQGSWTATVNYGDGSGVQPLTLNGDKSFALSHSYAKSGSYTITVSVIDAGVPGTPGVATVPVTVGNVAPTVGAGPDRVINEGSLYNGGGTFVDPGANTWNGAVNYGDGTGTKVLTLQPNKTFGLSHLYTKPGNYTITVTIIDTDLPTLPGATTVNVTVLPVVPQVFAGPSTTINMLDNYVGGGIFVDPGSNSWTATVDYGDGSGPQGLSLNADKTFALSHQYTTPGNYNAVVTVTDLSVPGQPGSSTIPITVKNVTPAPVIGGSILVRQFFPMTVAGSFSDAGNGAWTATVDYGDGTGKQPLALSSKKTYQLTHTYAVAGNFQAIVSVTDQYGATGTTSVGITVVAPPTVSIKKAWTTTVKGGALASVGLLFDGDVSPSVAANAKRYVIIGAGRDRKLGTRDDVFIRFRAARVLHDTVTLVPVGRPTIRGGNSVLQVSNVVDTYARPLGHTTNGVVSGSIKPWGIIEFPS